MVFLSFSRLSPGTKGDFQALVVRWREIREKFPRAVLALSGSNVDKAFVNDLRQLVRAAGVGDGVLIVDDPFDLAPDARNRLMSAADVFVHLTTGVEEASSMVVPEAMAHSPYEPAPDTNFIERGLIKAMDFIHGQHGNLRDLAKFIDDRNPIAGGYFQGVIGAGETLGKDLIPIVGPDPNVETRPKPWVW